MGQEKLARLRKIESLEVKNGKRAFQSKKMKNRQIVILYYLGQENLN